MAAPIVQLSTRLLIYTVVLLIRTALRETLVKYLPQALPNSDVNFLVLLHIARIMLPKYIILFFLA